MGKEIELKLHMSPREVRKLMTTRWLFPGGGGTSKGAELLSVYFDTPKYRLQRHGISLRVRQIGRTRVQTIKTRGCGIPFSRGEWEHAIEGDTPDLRFAKETPLSPVLDKKLKRALVPVFTTAVHRIAVPIHESGSLIEMALDRGLVRAGRKTSPIAEVELELKRGDVTDLFKLARRIAKVVPAKLAFMSKSELGYELLAGKPAVSVHATKIRLERHVKAREAFQIIGRSILRHVAANEPAVRMGDSESVHQMRVGLRRLRAAISVFSPLLAGKQTEMVKAELVWMTGELQYARDLDVYVQTDVEPMQNRRLGKPGLRKFAGELAVQRRLAVKKVKETVESARYQSLILDTLQWIEAGDWLKRSVIPAKQSIRRFAAASLARQTKKVLKKQTKLRDLDERHLHKLRITFKKLRYSSEFFGSLFTGPKMKQRRGHFNDCLKIMQDDLGALNDIAVHKKLTISKRLPATSLYADLISRREQQKIDPLLKKTVQAARKFSRARPFWGQ